jgi:hypothetical protein
MGDILLSQCHNQEHHFEKYRCVPPILGKSDLAVVIVIVSFSSGVSGDLHVYWLCIAVCVCSPAGHALG